MLQLNHPREGRVQPGLGSRRPRQPASETRLVARRTREAPRLWKTLQQRSVGQDELDPMDARGVNLTSRNGDKLSGRRGTIIFTSAAP